MDVRRVSGWERLTMRPLAVTMVSVLIRGVPATLLATGALDRLFATIDNHGKDCNGTVILKQAKKIFPAKQAIMASSGIAAP